MLYLLVFARNFVVIITKAKYVFDRHIFTVKHLCPVLIYNVTTARGSIVGKTFTISNRLKAIRLEILDKAFANPTFSFYGRHFI